jgi:hypothetical protein
VQQRLILRRACPSPVWPWTHLQLNRPASSDILLRKPSLVGGLPLSVADWTYWLRVKLSSALIVNVRPFDKWINVFSDRGLPIT